jgi:hypothetical protein
MLALGTSVVEPDADREGLAEVHFAVNVAVFRLRILPHNLVADVASSAGVSTPWARAVFPTCTNSPAMVST